MIHLCNAHTPKGRTIAIALEELGVMDGVQGVRLKAGAYLADVDARRPGP